MSTTLGRLSSQEVGKPVVADAPEKQMAAVLSKLDEVSGLLKSLTAKLDADTGVTGTDYAATLTASLKLIDLTL